MVTVRRIVILALPVVALGCTSAGPAAHPGTGGSEEEGGSGGTAVGGSGGRTNTGGTSGPGTGGAAATGGAPATGGTVETGGVGGQDAGPTDSSAAAPGPDGSPAMPMPGPDNCVLKWSPSAAQDGDGAFEGLEMPDGRGTHPGVVHFYTVPEHDAYRVDQHYDPPGVVDLDNHPDRLRCEVKGMHAAAGNLVLLQGQHWRISWSLYLPSTGSFTDIFQMKYVDTGGGSSGSPIFTINLHREVDAEKLVAQAQLAPGLGDFPAQDLTALRERWLTNTFDFQIGAGGAGRLRWSLSDGTKTVVDIEKQVPTWPADAARLRPKWGLYRKLGDPNLKTTYMLISELKAYQCQ